MFKVSPALIYRAVDVIEASTAAQPAINAAWHVTSKSEREQFVRGHLAEIWRLIEVATA